MADERYAEFTEETPKSYLQNLFEESSTQKHKLGTLRTLSDGRQFVYARAGAANIAAGYLCCAETEEAANLSDWAITANAAVGARTLAVTVGDLAAAIVANEFNEGYIYEDLANAANSCAYKIKSHPAFAANASGNIEIYDKVRSALTTSLTLSAVHNPHRAVIIHPSPPLNTLIGVTAMPITANYYGWFQKRGPAPVTITGTVVVGDEVFPAAVDGSVGPGANGTSEVLAVIGIAMANNANDCFALIDLKL